MQLNAEAVKKANALIDEGKFRISTPWRQVQPSSEAETKYAEKNGWQAYGQWYLAINPDAPEGSKERYLLPFGDFNSIHRSGLMAARQEAEKAHNSEIEQAADDLLFIFDRLNAC